MAKLTHGETIYHRRENLDFSQSLHKMAMSVISKVPKRMERKEAMTYYKAKLNDVWSA